MTAYFIHAGFMFAALLFITTGALIARLVKLKRSYFRFHKPAGFLGVTSALLGFAIISLAVAVSSGRHFSVPHTYLGALVLVMLVGTLTLGNLQFKWREKTREIRTVHRWAGRTSVMLAALAVLSGFYTAGIFPGIIP